VAKELSPFGSLPVFSEKRMWKQIGKKRKIISLLLEGFDEFE